MNKRFSTPLLMLVFAMSPLVAAKKTHDEALNDVHIFIEQTTAKQGIFLDPATKTRLFQRSKEELTRRQDARGYVETADIAHIKKEFTAFAKTLIANPETTGYFSAIKNLKNHMLTIYENLVPKSPYSAKQALWLKIKKQLIDKELRKKAFILKEELVVNQADITALSAAITTRVNDLVSGQRKKNDRMISLGYAESKVRDLLRRSGYRNQEHITAIMQLIQKDLKRVSVNNRIAQSKLENLAIAAMKRFKHANLDPHIISRLAAEVKMLTAIKKAKLPPAQEITATNNMIDTLNRKSSRDNLTEEFVNEVIKETLDRLKEKLDRKKERAAIKNNTQIAAKKTKERGAQTLGQTKSPKRNSP